MPTVLLILINFFRKHQILGKKFALSYLTLKIKTFERNKSLEFEIN
jgi:hypothetical protein